MQAGFTNKGLAFHSFANEYFFNQYVSRHQFELTKASDTFVSSFKKDMTTYFEGRTKYFDWPLDLYGTDFQKEVWKSLLSIAYGETMSYQEQALLLGNSNAVRAVAQANKRNPIAIIIPCHRVIGKNGNLTGYASGVAIKKVLLDHEKRFK